MYNIKKIILFLIFTIAGVITLFLIFHEEIYIEYAKHNFKVQDSLYCYKISNGSYQSVYGINTLKDKDMLLQFCRETDPSLNSGDWNEFPFLVTNDYVKVGILKYTPDSSLALIRIIMEKKLGQDPYRAVYIPVSTLHSELKLN